MNIEYAKFVDILFIQKKEVLKKIPNHVENIKVYVVNQLKIVAMRWAVVFAQSKKFLKSVKSS